MLRHQRTVGLVVIVAGLVWGGIAEAQPGGGRRGGGPGMGGPGGGGPLMLAGNPAIQKEIGLEGDDAAKVQKIIESFREEMMAESEKAGVVGGPAQFQLSPEERQANDEKRMGVMKKLNDKFLPQLKESLGSSQFERLQQIHWQAAGSQALVSPELGKALDLSKEQREKITGINQDYGQKQREMFAPGAGGAGAGGPPDFQAIGAKMRELTKERDGKATEVLSKEQQEKYTKLKGKPFDLAQLMQGGPGGRGGPGGPGGRPAGAAGRPQKKDADK